MPLAVHVNAGAAKCWRCFHIKNDNNSQCCIDDAQHALDVAREEFPLRPRRPSLAARERTMAARGGRRAGLGATAALELPPAAWLGQPPLELPRPGMRSKTTDYGFSSPFAVIKVYGIILASFETAYKSCCAWQQASNAHCCVRGGSNGLGGGGCRRAAQAAEKIISPHI
eukprot:717110-Pleurochrysis_carterae.AAC.3